VTCHDHPEKDEQSLDAKGKISESHCCVDCGVNTAPGCPPGVLAAGQRFWQAGRRETSGSISFSRAMSWLAATAGPLTSRCRLTPRAGQFTDAQKHRQREPP